MMKIEYNVSYSPRIMYNIENTPNDQLGLFLK